MVDFVGHNEETQNDAIVQARGQVIKVCNPILPVATA